MGSCDVPYVAVEGFRVELPEELEILESSSASAIGVRLFPLTCKAKNIELPFQKGG